MTMPGADALQTVSTLIVILLRAARTLMRDLVAAIRSQADESRRKRSAQPNIFSTLSEMPNGRP